MSLNSPPPAHLEIPKTSRRGPILKILAVAAIAASVMLGVHFWRAGYRPSHAWQAPVERLKTVSVDRGDMAALVTETGTLESASNVTVRCQVEALIGMVGGSRSGSGGSRGGSSGGSGGGSSGGGTQYSQATPAKASGGVAKGGGGAKGMTKGAGSASSASAGGGSSGGAGSGGATPASTLTRPQIASFTMKVTPYSPLRVTIKAPTPGSKGSGGGGGGGGGDSEKPGSTRILWIKPEGTPVQAGEVVCELDSAAFKDEVLAQRIKYDQAKAYVNQAKAILGVNEVARTEYKDGILPQDQMLINQYLNACITDEKRLLRNVNWSKEAVAKGFRSPAQHLADELAHQRAVILLDEARAMQERLVKYTAPKLLKTLDAKLEANRADILAQEGAFQLESDRLERLEKMVANCTLRAPSDGIVVYAQPPSNGWRTSSTVIQEGVTVREGQAIFELPDSRHMRVKARVNESKIREVQIGQRAMIKVDAFPDRELAGSVSEITAIPAPGAGPFSDTRVYFVNVTIDDGAFEGLRSGLTAEISFLVGRRAEVTRVPIASVRWNRGRKFVAVATNPERTEWEWKPIELGLMNDAYAEVLSGLEVGDQVVIDPHDLRRAFPDEVKPTLQARGEADGKPSG
ncbi:efflux RND transporter periplasmic adaptor subunit [Tundrisphaera sp. TA3]|uniref:efflux RND transporter periplasmic adaptor subunit n=1 Tax=Tundrisphaera sp. TA3 TaxID=3435775 RepID=UPI003EB7077C